MKKIIAGISLLALAVAVLPASASTISNLSGESLGVISNVLKLNLSSVNNNSADIVNEVSSTANSGRNTISSEKFQSNTSISTGAANAVAIVTNEANSISVDSNISVKSCECNNDKIENIHGSSAAKIRNKAIINEEFENFNSIRALNQVAAASESGLNTIGSGDGLQHSAISAGSSTSATDITNAFNRISEKLNREVR